MLRARPYPKSQTKIGLSAAVLTMILLAAAPTAAGADPGRKCVELTIGSASERHEVSIDFARAIETYDFHIIGDAFATCRAAIARNSSYSGFPRAYLVAVKYISLHLFGAKFNGGEKEGFALAIAQAKKASPQFVGLYGLYIGSAYEYGRGTPRNLDEAKRWYGKAAAAGNKIAARELARLG